MQYKMETGSLWQCKSDVVVLGVFLDEDLSALLEQWSGGEAPFREKLLAYVQEQGFSGKAGQFLSLPTYRELPFKQFLLAGLGKKSSDDLAVYRRCAANIARRLSGSGALKSVCFLVRGGTSGDAELRCLVEGFGLGSFAFRKYKTQTKEENRAEIEELSFLGSSLSLARFTKVCHVADWVASATNMARRLIAEPASYMTPTRLAQEAERLAAEHGMQCRVIDAEEAKELKMGAFLGVAAGAKEPAKFIVLHYQAAAAKKTLALVGKGITFDSGGLSLKPALSMEHMKYDMSGAAVVLGAMQVVGAVKPEISVLGVIAATENMPGDNALHPGDVLTAMNGKTIEVNNTDAEGRLVLADAISFVCKQGADEIIDVATLTGAIVTALGRAAAGIMGNNQALIDRLIKSGAEAGEKLWQMPLFDEYKESLKSDVADLKNAGSRGEAGSSCAGMFLREFAESKDWAHLDIAGPGWLDKDRDECNKGGTAFGVRTLSYYALAAAHKPGENNSAD